MATEPLKRSIIFVTPKDVDPILELSELKSSARKFKKEHIYVGTFSKKLESGEEVEFSVDEELIDHWVRIGNEQLADGIQIPVPLEHTTDPEKNRGLNLHWFKAKDSKGRIGLFSIVEFRDDEAAKIAKTAQTSIWVPLEWFANGKTYHRPVKHTALTDYPVVGDLDRFEPIVASLTSDFKSEEKRMTVQELADKLGVTYEEGASEEDISTAVLDAFDEMKAKLKELEPPVEAAEEEEEEEEDKEKKKELEASTLNKPMLGLLRESRSDKIDRFLTERRITPAQATKVKALYCSDGALGKALKSGDDGFDNALSLLAMNNPSSNGSGESKTGPQVLELSSADLRSTTKNPLLRDAERRAAEAKKR